jgi:protease-4
MSPEAVQRKIQHLVVYLKELQKYEDDDDIKVLVLRINSPGGAIGPSQEIYRQVIKFRESGKKVVVSMGTVAASGGYYIASAADKIVASPGTVTGSIGVIMQSFGVKELTALLKVEPRIIKSGKLKDAGSPFRDMTPEEQKYLQALSDNMYDQFVKDIAKERKMPIEKVRELAEGIIYSGEQAKEVGLVDELGNYFDAIELARELAGLPKDAKVKWPRKPSPFEEFFSETSSARSLQNLFLKLETQYLPLWLSPVSSVIS